jgi:hypothetical protein
MKTQTSNAESNRNDSPRSRSRLQRVVSRIREWWWRQRIAKACDEAGARISKMTTEERIALSARARSIMYPDGYWTCRNHGELVEYKVATGLRCPVCDSANDKL